MAANPRRLVVAQRGDGVEVDINEHDDFETAMLTYRRDGGLTDLALTFKRPFMDWREMDEAQKYCRFYWDDKFIFEGRLRSINSRLNSGGMTVPIEGRDAWLKEISGEIKITSDGEWADRFTDDGIDVGQVVKILFEEFIVGAPYGEASTPPGFYRQVGYWSIDTDTGVDLNEFRWNGSGDLWQVLKSLAEAAGFYHWGFMSPQDFKGRFHFRPPADTASYLYSNRLNLADPYIEDAVVSKELKAIPRTIRILGAWIAANRQYVYRHTDETIENGYGVREYRMPWISDNATALTVCNRLFDYFRAKEKPDCWMRVCNLSGILDDPWEGVGLRVDSRTVSSGAPDSLTYQCNEILKMEGSVGEVTGNEGDVLIEIEKIIDEKISETAKPSGITAENELYQETVLYAGRPMSQNEDDTYEVDLLTPGLESTGKTASSVPIFGGHAGMLAIGVAATVVKVIQVITNGDPGTSQYYIDNAFQAATDLPEE